MPGKPSLLRGGGVVAPSQNSPRSSTCSSDQSMDGRFWDEPEVEPPVEELLAAGKLPPAGAKLVAGLAELLGSAALSELSGLSALSESESSSGAAVSVVVSVASGVSVVSPATGVLSSGEKSKVTKDVLRGVAVRLPPPKTVVEKVIRTKRGAVKINSL